MKKILGTISVSVLGAIIGVLIYTRFVDNQSRNVIIESKPVELVNFSSGANNVVPDFVLAAEHSVHGVVNVKTESVRETYYRNPIYEFFYGERYKEQTPVVGIGSGVIISDKGYIVTNNHVIDNFQSITVTLNDKREFTATIIGQDPSTDLAVLKIEQDKLPYIPYGNSDDLKVGEWVLAVGNPFNLTSTVTAGIVSAKGRSLKIINDHYRLESFIQTDAAVNKGNSGGALVNTRGELVGINTAIISPSGGSVGNSFAIPVSIVKKIVDDIIEFGTVQRALLGVTIDDVNSEVAKNNGLDKIKGVFVKSIADYGAAKDAGIKSGDIIIEINNISVNSTSELQEQIGRYRPGDKISVTILRDNKKKLFEVVLRNMQGEAQLIKDSNDYIIYGATLKSISEGEKNKLNIGHGVKVDKLERGKLMREGAREGFVITHVNEYPVNNVDEMKSIVERIRVKDGIYIKGIYPDGTNDYYAFEK